MIDQICPCLSCIANLLNQYFSDKSERVRPPETDEIPVDLHHRNVMR